MKIIFAAMILAAGILIGTMAHADDTQQSFPMTTEEKLEVAKYCLTHSNHCGLDRPQGDRFAQLDLDLKRNEELRIQAEAADEGWIGNVKQAAATLAGE